MILAFLLFQHLPETEIAISRLNLNRREIWLLSSEKAPEMLVSEEMSLNDAEEYAYTQIVVSSDKKKIGFITYKSAGFKNWLTLGEISLQKRTLTHWKKEISYPSEIYFGFDSSDHLSLLYADRFGKFHKALTSGETDLKTFDAKTLIAPRWSKILNIEEQKYDGSTRISYDSLFKWGISEEKGALTALGKRGAISKKAFAGSGTILSAVPATFPTMFAAVDESGDGIGGAYSSKRRAGIYMADFESGKAVRIADGFYVVCLKGGIGTPRDR